MKHDEINAQETSRKAAFLLTHRVIGNDGRFVAYDDGTVLDTRTNLMWAAKDNGSHINRENAKTYCENYRGGGYTDWRMPTQDELAGLYDNTKKYLSDCDSSYIHLTTLIRTCWWVWAEGSSETGFNFAEGNGNWHPWGFSLDRALPVRSDKTVSRSPVAESAAAPAAPKKTTPAVVEVKKDVEKKAAKKAK